jgi:hypothetical protein
VTVLALFPEHDTPGKRDSSGAFRPGAREFALEHGGTSLPINARGPKAARRKAVIAAIGDGFDVRYSAVAFFCHGWRTGIQFGFDLAHVSELAAAIARSGATIVPLYACSTAQGGAGGDGGFADALRDALCVAGVTTCRVDAHDSKGHTFRNPRVRRFEGRGSPTGGMGGEWIVRPEHALFGTWRLALSDSRLWAQFPFFATAEIHGRLAARRTA